MRAQPPLAHRNQVLKNLQEGRVQRVFSHVIEAQILAFSGTGGGYSESEDLSQF